jgi:hypothetical protein
MEAMSHRILSMGYCLDHQGRKQRFLQYWHRLFGADPVPLKTRWF